MSWRGKTIAGFTGRDKLARLLAREVGALYVPLTTSTYRAGERVVRASRKVSRRCLLVTNVEADAESIWNVLLAADALHRAGAQKIVLFAPWIAYGRQDRPSASRESKGGIVLGEVLHPWFAKIVTLDAHSKLFRKNFHGRLRSISLRDLVIPAARTRGATAIAAPDHGALKRAKRAARKMRLPFILCEKKRLKPGVGGVRTRIASGSPQGERVLLVDDMIDSGGTLAEAAKALRAAGAKSVGAVVTHAALPTSVPNAKSLGLGFLDVLYRRVTKPLPELIRFFKRHL